MPNPETVMRFDEIYDSTRKAVLAFITVKCGHTTDIADIFQETYMEVYQILCRRGTEYVTNEKALVMRVTKRKIARYYSLLERLRMFVSLSTVNADGENVELNDLHDYDADAFLTEDYAVDMVMLESVQKILKSKPEDVQKVFYLMYKADLTIPEIAKALSISESNVKNKLYRTIKDLRTILN